MDQEHIDEVARRLRESDPGRYARTQVDLEKLTGKTIDDLDPLTAAEVIVELESEKDSEPGA